MRVKKGFKLHNICGENVIIAEGIENIDFTNIISMNETSAYLWGKIEDKNSFEAEELAKMLLEKYDVDYETAYADVSNLIKSWSEAEIIE